VRVKGLSHHRKSPLIGMAGGKTSLAKIDTFEKGKGYNFILEEIESILGVRFQLFVFPLIPSKSLFFFSLI